DRAGLRPLGIVHGWSQAMEPGHLYSEQPYRGDGLAMAVQQTVASASSVLPVGEVYSSMNGESHWAKEWGVAFIRNRTAFAEDYRTHHPADCFGDTGAASGPIMAGLAVLGFADAYRTPPALVYGSSDRGQRAAVLITA
ncbi:MAG: hypothetical protein ACREIV_15060, partial [Planctomycetaceae bacterium]